MAIPYLAGARRAARVQAHVRRPPRAQLRTSGPPIPACRSGARSSARARGGRSTASPSFPGLVLLVLAPWGAVAGWRAGPRCGARSVTGLALSVAGAALAIGAGPNGWRRYAPYRLLFEYVPGWEALRATGRAWVVGLLGVGRARRARRARHRPLARRAHVALRGRRTIGLVTTVAVVGVLVEGYAPWTDRPDIRGVRGRRATRPSSRTLAACCTSPRSSRERAVAARSAASARPRTSTAPPRTTADPERVLRLLPAVVGAAVEGDAFATGRRRRSSTCATRHPLRGGARVGAWAARGTAARPRPRRALAPARHVRR